MSDEKRRSFRIPNPENDGQAVIKIRRRKFVVRLVDQSAGGFAVASKQLPRVKEGTKVQVRTPGGWSESVVVRVEKKESEIILGLRRLGDMPDPRDHRASFSLPFRLPGRMSSAPLVTLFITAAVIFWFLAGGMAWFIDHGGGKQRQINVSAWLDRAWNQSSFSTVRQRENTHSPADEDPAEPQ